jgi:hypothetical protein
VSALERLHRARTRLALIASAKAVLWAGLGAAAALLAVLGLDIVVGLGVAARARLTPAPWLAGGAILAWHLAGPVRAALVATDEAVALWFERRVPQLRYALVTQAGLAGRSDALEAVVAAAPLEGEIRAAAKQVLARPGLALLLMVALLSLMPTGAVRRVVAPAAGDALARPGSGARAAADPLATIVVRVQPPAYSGLAARAYDDPATVAALAGSRVTVEGRGRDVRAIRDGVSQSATASGDRWQLTLALPTAAEAVRLVAPGRERVLVLEPIADSVPTVRLTAPARDSVLRAATGTLPLAAEVSDDLGLAGGAFELIISAGSGELYTFRTVLAAARTFDAGVRTGALSGAVRLDTLRLGPGDLIHLRAVARDRNDVTGPGRGASETRTIRIARADEYDSVAVDPAPPSEPEKDALSQRMILEQTRALVRRAPRLATETVTRESRLIAVDQTRLRKKVGEVVFTRLSEDAGEHAHFAGDGHEHGQEGLVDPNAVLAAAERAANADPTRNLDNHGDETPVVAINRPLLEAYNHMWRASGELEIGNPAAAIPWMERAIAALQRARAAERIYLRGRPPRVVVDLARVRLSGKDEGAPRGRTPRPPADPQRALRLSRFDAALGVVERNPAAAADSLLLLRVTLPAEERSAALALDAAASALRQGGDVTRPLAAARRALVAEPPRRSPFSPWGN